MLLGLVVLVVRAAVGAGGRSTPPVSYISLERWVAVLVGEVLRRARVDAGLSQAEVARRAATSQSAVSAYERGLKSPSVATLQRLLAATGHTLQLRLGARSVAADLSGPVGRLLHDRMAEVREVLGRHRASNPRVFGSVAMGQDRADSDLDLLVALPPDATLLDLVALHQDLADVLGIGVDVVTDGALGDDPFAEVVRAQAVPL